MTIGQVAGRAGVNVQTLRYYERIGLIAEPARRRSGYRDYPDETVRVVRFIKRAQELGFRLEDVAELLALAGQAPGSCQAVRKLARDKMAELDRRIADLTAMRASLARLVATCDRPHRRRECPLIETLDHEATEVSP